MKRIFLLVLMFVIAPVAFGDGDAAAGKKLTAVCAACHGPDGNSPSDAFPNLAGQNTRYLAKQLTEIKSGMRAVPTMTGQLDAMSLQDFEDIAAYYASLAKAQGVAATDQVELGESIYRVGISRKNIAACSACHSPTGSGNNPAGFPALSGQWPAYTISQLKAFQAGSRHNDGDGKMMQDTAEDMNEKEMSAVAAYIYGLR